MAVTRNAYAGAAIKTTITSGINATDTSIVLANATGWPTGAQFPVVIDPSAAGEEKVLVTRSGSTLTVVGGAAGRGYDDTVGASHAGGAEIYPCISANEMDDFNRLASTPTTKGDLIGADASGNPVRLAVGTDHKAVIADSSQASGLAYANAPKGLMGYAEVTTTQSGITAIADLTSLTLTFTAIASRRYRTRVIGTFLSTIANDFGRIDICDGSNTLIEAAQHLLQTTGAVHFAEVIETGLSGSITRKARYQRTVGTGSLSLSVSAASSGSIIVEDIGPA